MKDIVLTKDERKRFSEWCKQRRDECNRWKADCTEDPTPAVYGNYAKVYNSMSVVLDDGM